MKWSLLVLLPILWNYGNCQETEGPEATIDLYQGIGSNPADIVFLLDTSTSNDVDLYNKIRSFLVHFVESSSVESGEVRFAFVPYSNYPDVKFYLNKYSKKADIITAIRDATFNYGERNTADAFDLLRRQVFTETNGDRPQIPNVVLMVTTGTSDRNSYRTIQEAEALRFAGVGIFLIGIGLTNTRELEEMASRPTRENTFQLGSADELESVRDIAFAQIFTRAEQAFRSPVSGSEQIDLMFLLHFSNNMRKEGLNSVLDFIQNLLEYADIDSGRVRVGISIYRKLATGLYNLDRFSTKAELMEGIKQITTQYKAKAANTAAGLDFVRTNMFVQKAGDRPNVPNAVIIITDANTNINQADAITAAEAVKAAGTAIFSIGIGLENPDELDALATSRDFSLALTQASELNSNIIYLQDRINALKTLADLPSPFPSTTPPSLTTTTTTAHAVVMTIQPPSSVENSKEADIVLTFHSSKKTQVKLFKKSLLKFLADLAQKADIDSGAVRIALVAYGKTPEIIFDFNTYHSSKDLVKAIRKTTKNYRYKEASAFTALDIIQSELFKEDRGDRPNVPNGMILITDSKSNSKAAVQKLALQAKRVGNMKLFAIGLGQDSYEEIAQMASEPVFENTYLLNSYSDLLSSSTDITSKIAKQIKAFNREEADIVLAFHCSEQTTVNDFKKGLLTLFSELVSSADVDSGAVRFALVGYGKDASVIFEFNSYQRKNKVLKALKKVMPTHRSQEANTLDLILKVNTEVFSASKGDRIGVPNIMIFVTDSPNTAPVTEIGKKAKALKDLGTSVFSIGVQKADPLEINAMASEPSSKYSYTAHNYSEMLNSADLKDKLSKAYPIFEGIGSSSEVSTTKKPEKKTKSTGKTPKKTKGTGKPLTKTKTTARSAVVQDTTTVAYKATALKTDITTNRTVLSSVLKVLETLPYKEALTASAVSEAYTTLPDTREVTPDDHRLSKKQTTVTFLGSSVTPPLSGSEKADIVFAVHLSDTATARGVQSVLNYLNSLISGSDVENGRVQIGLLIYSADAEVIFNINQYRSVPLIRNEILRIATRERSKKVDASAALSVGTQMLDFTYSGRMDAPKALIFVTDRASTENAELIPFERFRVESGQVNVFSVGIGLSGKEELEDLATAPENVLTVSSYSELPATIDDIKRKIFAFRTRDEKTVPEPEKPETTKPELPIRTLAPPRQEGIGITLVPRNPCADAQVDFVYILDASTSVTQVNFEKMLDFCKQLLAQAEIDNGNVQVGVVVYSTDVKIEFHLNRYKTKSDVMDAIDKIKYIYGSTNTAGGLKTMREEMFSFRNGDRPDVPNVAIILTDGVSNINARRTVPEAEQARAEGIHIYAIGIGLTDTRELNAIASSPASENSFSVKTFDDLKAVEEKVFTSLCPVIRGKQPTTVSKKIATDRTESTSIKVATIQKTSVATTRATTRRPTTIKPTTPKPTPTTTRPTTIKPTTPKPTTPKPTPTTTKSTTLKITTPKPTTPKPTSTTTKSTTPKPTTPRPTTLKPTPATTKSTTTATTPKPTTPKPTPTATKLTTTQPTTQKPTTPKPTPTTTKSTTPQPTTQKPTTPKPTPTTTKSTTPKPTIPKPTTPKPTSTTTKSTTPAPRRDGYDLVMVLDSSVNSTTFNWMMDIARSTIKEISIDDEEWRVGILTYSTSPNREFHLNQYKKKADVLRQLDRVYYRPGQTNTAAALKYARTNMFRESNGDRDFAKNYLMLITGNEKSVDMYAAANEAYQMQRDGVGTYVIGLGINDRTELDELASLPLADYEVIIPAPNQIRETPGQIIYNMKSRSPTPNPPPTRPLRITTTSRPVRPDPLLACKSTGDIVFILDSSGSVGLENFFRVLNFTFNTVDELDMESGNYRVGLVTFSDSARIEFYLNAYTKREEVKNALEKVRYVYGSTHTAAALRRARLELFRAEAGDRQDVPNVVVTITDGNSNVNNEMTLVEADLLKRAGVSLITVAVGFQRQTRELVGLTSAPVEENLIYVDDYKSLDKLSQKLVEPLCSDSDLCRNNPCRNDAVCVDGIRSYMCLCPESYYGTNCEKQCSEPADVAFILDSSNTVGERNFQMMKDYAGSLIQEMNVEACDINIGLMKYSSAPMMQWGLGMHRDTDTNLRAVNQVQYTRGVANMAAALKALRTDIFNGRGGDRPKAKNIAYLLTDGSNMVHEEDTQKNAELAISSGIRIIPVGVSLRDREEVDLIAGAQNLNTIIIDEALGEINEAALAPMVKATDYCAGNPCKNAAKCVNEPYGFTCDCLAGFTGDDCSRRCSAGGDVVFAVDTSRYVTRKEMKHVRRFLRSVVKRLRFKEFKTGLVQYSNTANVILTFADGDKKKNVLSAIAGLRNMPGDPDPAEALAKANFRIFKGDGAMKDEPDYLVLLSKGLKKEEELLTQSNKLKMKGTRILGVGIGLTSSEKELMESVVSYPTSDTVYYADDVERLDDVADKVVEFMCNGQDKCAQNPCQNKGKCHAVGAEYYCDCPLGFAGKNCELKCDAKADIVFLLDSSGSVGHVDFRKVKDFAYRMIDDLNIGKEHTRVGLVAYSSRSRHGFYLKDYYDKYQLQNAISSIGFEYGKTNTADGLRHVREKLFNSLQGDRPDAQNFVVVITDGLSNIKSDQTLVEADLLKANGVHVYAIGIGKFDRYEIDRIASAPASQNAFILEDYASLGTISSDIIRATCKDPSVCDENPCRNDGKCEPTINGPVCKCAGGYRGKYCDMSCVSKKDIIFVLDSSASVGEENFELTLEFVSSVVEELSRGGSDNRYALITFSNDVQLVFSLGRYPSAGIILNAIKYTRYRPGSTNTAGGLRTVLEISSPEYGDRKDVDNIVMLVADGQSNVNAQDTIPAADDLKKTGAKIITIGVGLSNYQELESVASGSDNVYKVNTYNLLDDVKADILESSCSGNG